MSLCPPSLKPGLPTLDGWQFTPEGAAIHPEQRTAVIADLHLGYEWARGASGDCVVAHSLEETLARLATLLGRSSLSQLIVAGDLIESARPCPDTALDIDRFRNWLADRNVQLLVLEGNHDVGFSLSAKKTSNPSNHLPETCMVAGWTVGHGHRPIEGSHTISGHHHPVFRCQGIAAPCFLVGPTRIVLPAFSANAAGCNVVSSALPRDWLDGSLRCLVSTGDEVLDFGPVSRLRRRLQQEAR